MELQCKERVDLLEALKQSREDSAKDGPDSGRIRKERTRSNHGSVAQQGGWLGDSTVPPMLYSEIPNPNAQTQSRPSYNSQISSNSIKDRTASEPKVQSSPLGQTPHLPVPSQQKSRSPSPDHGRKTMRRTLRPEGRASKTSRPTSSQTSRPTPMKAAGLAWDVHPRANSIPVNRIEADPTIEARLSATAARRSLDQMRLEQPSPDSFVKMPDPNDYIPSNHWRDTSFSSQKSPIHENMARMNVSSDNVRPKSRQDVPAEPEVPPPPPPHAAPMNPVTAKAFENPPPRLTKPPQLSYRKEYLPAVSNVSPSMANHILEKAYSQRPADENVNTGINRKPVPGAKPQQVRPPKARKPTASDSEEIARKTTPRTKRPKATRNESGGAITPPSTDADSPDDSEQPKSEFDKRAEHLMKNLPKGIDELAAKNILNEIVVKGDEVHWDDVAGLTAAKKALKEAVVYPFLRPDLFMGLREPARGMLLFGPPGTGKTMLARAVATESKSTFFAISASSLTSKWHGESEKLVRALFGMAKALAPSIIFVDEIDSLLSSRGGGSEHEASRRSKTEFLIQWSDLQRAAAGKETSIGDPSRVLVLAATNCPWDIDEAARRRFVRRQYIPLPEVETRDTQIRTLLGAQKHGLSDRDIRRLVRLTEGKH